MADASIGIIGAYNTKYEYRSPKSAFHLIQEAVKGVLDSVDKGIEPSEIDMVIVANLSDRFGGLLHTGPLVLNILGNMDAKSFRVENACAAGGTALYLAWYFAKTGLARNVLVLGYEKMSYQPSSSAANEVLMSAGHPEEYMAGAPFVSLYALIAKAYMDKYGITEEDLALVAVKNHENALRNPLAQFHKKITVDDVLKSPYVSWPLKILDSSPLSDGAATVIVSSNPRQYTDTPVYIKAISMAHDHPGIHQREDMTAIIAANKAAKEAYKSANMTPKNIGVLEVHDAFTIAEIILYEMLGLVRRGEGVKLLRERITWFDGDKPVNPSGGLKAKGHPIGATGVGMACELYWQLRGEAGNRQVQNVEYGLMENHGGTGATSIVAIFGR